jgi:CheY-like chemotaxis protein/HPt (histidine-containing phosphotransfer) domain-containing protein
MIQSKRPTASPIVGKLGNLKVLLAEDNEVNQLLAKGILQYWGLESKIAVTGFEVLSLMEKENFDIVLMDIQMPEKSGIEAANEIRKLTDTKKKNVPIIALTANALKGEEKKYIAAGMDDFLTKPFKETELYDVIERVLRKEGSFHTSGAVDGSAPLKPLEQIRIGKLYELKQVEELAAGNHDFVLTLINIFLETIPQSSTEMLDACAAKNWDKVSKFAHKLKSTVDMLNMASIKTDIRTIELDAKKEINLDHIRRLVPKVDKIIQKTAQQLREEFSL